jgi:hypothetical protein
MKNTVDCSSRLGSLNTVRNNQKPGRLQKQILIAKELIENKELLVIQDDLFMGRQMGNDFLREPLIKGNEYGKAFYPEYFLHTDLVVDIRKVLSLGYSCVNAWNSTNEKYKQRKKKGDMLLTATEDSAYRMNYAKESRNRLKQARHMTLISHRSNDIYEEFLEIPDSKTDMIVSTSDDRPLYGREDTLFSYLAKQDSQGEIAIQLKRTNEEELSDYSLIFNIISVPVKITSMDRIMSDSLPDYIDLNAIKIKEKETSGFQEPITWTLLTTIRTDSFEETLKIIQYYVMKWQVEMLFTAIRNNEFGLEGYQATYDGSSIESYYATNLDKFLKIIQLMQAQKGMLDVSAEIIFNPDEMKILLALGKRYLCISGNQHVQYEEGTLSWASWVIGNIGGWRGDVVHTPACSSAIKDGLTAFCQICNEFVLSKLCA